MELFFYICLGIIVYAYFGYPAILYILALPKQNPPATNAYLPDVTMIISAHNEASVIKGKLENTLALDYPTGHLQIIVVSDGSDDGTQEQVAAYAGRGIQLLDIPEHAGKTAAQNRAFREATGEILVFSDANSLYHEQALRELVKYFGGDAVGCVCGELSYRDSQSPAGKSESIYWRYEQFSKRRESLFGALIGANGAIYAVRKECFVELEPQVISDFILPMIIYGMGRKVLYNSGALAFENPSTTFENEFRRKKRIIVRSLYGLSRHPQFLNIARFGMFSFGLWSHKMIRWLVPFFLIGMAVSNVFLLAVPWFQGIAVGQMLFYILALVGRFGTRRIRSLWPVYIPYYFTMINAAALIAVFECIIGERYDTWATTRS